MLDFALLAAWSALYYGINYYLLLEEEIDQRARLESQASIGAAGDAALPAQPAFPVQHAQQHLDPGAAEADRAGQCDAGAAVVLPALHAGQRADRAGHAGAGGRDAEALPRDREDAVRGPLAAAFPDRGRDDRRAAAVAAAPAADRKCDQICRHPERGRRRYLDYRAARRGGRCGSRSPTAARAGAPGWYRASRPGSAWPISRTVWRKPMARRMAFTTRTNEHGGFSVIIEIPARQRTDKELP